MSEVTRILSAIEQGDTRASEQLLPLVYHELRELARQRLALEKPGQTLQATALVHEAYLRLLGPEGENLEWANRGHFFAAAAEAMRRILVESARHKRRLKRGGERQRLEFEDAEIGYLEFPDELVEIDEALNDLEREDAQAAQLVKLRCFAGLSVQDAAEAAGISRSTAYEHWAFAKAWLLNRMRSAESGG